MRALGVSLALLAAACISTPLVQLEQPQGEAPPTLEVAPPQCEGFPLPAYPAEIEPERRPEKVSVQVAFTIDRSGRTTDVSGEVLAGDGVADTFLQAAVAAAATLRCKPAARITRVGEEGMRYVHIDYRSSLVCHFYRDERQVRLGG